MVRKGRPADDVVEVPEAASGQAPEAPPLDYGVVHWAIVEAIRDRVPYLVQDVADDIAHAALDVLADEAPGVVPIRPRVYF